MKLRKSVLATCSVLLLACVGAVPANAVASGSLNISPNMAAGNTLSTGYANSCSVNWLKKLYCWGDNNYDELHLGGAGDALTAQQVLDLTDVVQVANGYQHICAIVSSGDVYCWGDNTYGQLGRGDSGYSPWVPQPVVGLHNVVDISAGYRHTCAADSSGHAWCWGSNNYSVLGLGSNVSSFNTPQLVPSLSSVTDVAAGYGHSCALVSTGSVYCWGGVSDPYGYTTGNGNWGGSSTPQAVLYLSDAVSISTNSMGHHTCAVETTMQVRCWGVDVDHQIGGGWDFTTGSVEVAGLSNVVSVSAGYKHTCAVTSSGSVYCWGSIIWDNGRYFSQSSKRLQNVSGAVSVSAGYRHSCAVTSTGQVHCWGENSEGQLGNGNRATQINSVQVNGFQALHQPAMPEVTSVVSGNAQTSMYFSAPSDDGGSAITNYEYSLDGGTNWVTLSPAQTSGPILITGLLNGTSYPVALRAINALGSGAPSSTVTVVPCTIPSSPGIYSVAPSDGQVSVTFTAPASDGGSSITNYEYSTDGGSMWTSASPAQTTSPMVIPNLTNDQDYSVAIRAVNDAGSGASSDVFDAVPVGPPGSPTLEISEIGKGSFGFTGVAPVDTGGLPILDYEYSVNDGIWTSLGSVNLSIKTTLTSLTPGQNYTLRLRALNAVGAGLIASTSVTLPGIPEGPIYMGGNCCTLGWNEDFWYNHPGPHGEPARQWLDYTEYSIDYGHTWSPMPMTSDGYVRYRGPVATVLLIQSCNSIAGCSVFKHFYGYASNWPPAPPNVSISQVWSTSAVVAVAPNEYEWNSIGRVAYSVDGGPYEVVANSGTITLEGLSSHREHTVSVKLEKGTNSGVFGVPSSAIAFTTSTDVPNAPVIESIFGGNQSGSVAFSAPEDDGGETITRYEYSLDGGSTWIATDQASATSPMEVVNLTNGVEYSIVLRAVNSVGAGAASNSLSVTPQTVAGAPSVTSVDAGDILATIHFLAPSDNGGAAITNYEYSTDGGSSWTPAAPAQTDGTITVSGLVNGQTYSVAVRAVNAVGAGQSSDSVLVTPLATASSPTLTTVIPGDGYASVYFSAPANNGGAAVSNYEYSTDGGSTWVAAAPAQTTSPLVIQNLVNGQNYSVAIRPVNAVGSGASSSVESVKPSAPASKPSIVGVSTESGQVTLSVTVPAQINDSSLSGYDYSIDDGVTWSHFASVDGPFVIAGLTNGSTYQVKVRAVNSAGAGAASDVVSVKPVAPASAPSVTGVVAGNGQAALTVNAPSQINDSQLSGYDYSITNGVTWSHFASVDGPFVISGLTNGSSYQVKVRAVNSAGAGAASDAVAVKPTKLVPAKPVMASLVAGNGLATVTVATPSDATAQSITGYQYSINRGAFQDATISNGSFVISGLTNGVSVSITIRAVNVNGNSVASVSKFVVPVTTPQAPTITSVVSSAGALTVNLGATNAGGSAITRYQYSLDGGNSWISPTKLVKTSPIKITGLANATTYSVRVRAVNAVGIGAVSETVSASTPALVATAPVISSLTAGKTSITVNFTAPTNNGGTSVTNYAYTVDGTTWVTLNPATTSSPIVITGLTSYKTYSVKIRAINSAGQGAISGAKSAKTLK